MRTCKIEGAPAGNALDFTEGENNGGAIGAAAEL